MEPILDVDFTTEQAPVAYAGFWIRLGALLLDGLLLLPFIIIFFLDNYMWKNLPLKITLYAALILYKPLMEFWYGATLGKMALKLRVVNSRYKKTGFTAACIRNFTGIVWGGAGIVSIIHIYTADGFANATTFREYLKFVSANSHKSPSSFIGNSIVNLIDIIFLLTDSSKRSLHDRLAGTYVIRISNRSAETTV